MKKETCKKLPADADAVKAGNITPEELKKLSEVDIRTVNAKDLVDIGDVRINQELPVKERVLDYIRQVKNPYCYISHGVVVKIGFSGTRKLEECLSACISREA